MTIDVHTLAEELGVSAERLTKRLVRLSIDKYRQSPECVVLRYLKKVNEPQSVKEITLGSGLDERTIYRACGELYSDGLIESHGVKPVLYSLVDDDTN